MITSFEFLYEIRFKIFLNTLIKNEIQNKNALNFVKRRNLIRNEIYDAIKLIQIKMTIIFDNKHRSSQLIESIYLKMTKVDEINYHLFKTFFFHQKNEFISHN